MTALKLADGIETIAQNNSNIDEQIRGLMVDTATMLRQQHKELEHMWMANTVLKVEVEALKAKTLTDEEIHQIFRDESGFEIDTCPIAILDFARAILKKVSEK